MRLICKLYILRTKAVTIATLQLSVMNQPYPGILKKLFCSRVAQGVKFHLPLCHQSGVCGVEAFGESGVGHDFDGPGRVVQGDGPEKVHIHPADVRDSQSGIGSYEVAVLQTVHPGEGPDKSGLVFSSFGGQRPRYFGDFRRFHGEAYRPYLKASSQLTYHGVQDRQGVEVFMGIQMRWLYAPVDCPLDLCGQLGSYGISAFWSGERQDCELRDGPGKSAVGAEQRSDGFFG